MKPISRREQLLAYLAKNHQKATITVLMKLAYLIDFISIKRIKKPIFGYTYRRYTYGPFDVDIYKDVSNLQSKNILLTNSDYTQGGEEYIVYSFNNKAEDVLTSLDLSKKEESIINEILESLRGLGAKFLTEVAYKTKPMEKLGATLGGNENMGVRLDLTIN